MPDTMICTRSCYGCPHYTTKGNVRADCSSRSFRILVPILSLYYEDGVSAVTVAGDTGAFFSRHHVLRRVCRI